MILCVTIENRKHSVLTFVSIEQTVFNFQCLIEQTDVIPVLILQKRTHAVLMILEIHKN